MREEIREIGDLPVRAKSVDTGGSSARAGRSAVRAAHTAHTAAQQRLQKVVRLFGER